MRARCPRLSVFPPFRPIQSVTVSEPTLEQTVIILAGLRPKYEEYHGVTYSDEALAAAAALSTRYITDR